MPNGIPTPHGRGDFIDRGDVPSYDFTTPNFITDGNEHELDLSEIVPPGVAAVLLGTSVYDETPDVYITFKKKGNQNNINIALTGIVVRNVQTYLDLICPVGDDRILIYKATNTAWTWIYLYVKGWWLK